MSSIYTSSNDQYFYSNKIKVFPCAYRNSTYDATARLNTEYNFTHLPHTVDKASYIIKFNDKSKSEPKAELICVIQGYYFEIELGDGDYATLQNKYLNICVASPNGVGSIESPHLCSWGSSNTEDTLDIKSGSDTFFAGLKISSGEALSKDTYKCYALKLGASAKLPIMANKIENSAGTGKPISQEFTTEILSATTIISTPDLRVASDKLTVNSNNITANVPVTINSTLNIKAGNTSVLKAESTKVTINKPATIMGKTTIGSGDTKTEIENSTIKTSAINIASNKLIVDSKKVTANIPVTINNTLDVKTETGETSVLTANESQVTINKPTEIKGTSGNLRVDGTGSFGGKLTAGNAPKESNDVVRLGDLDMLTLGNVPILTHEQVNSLF